MGCGTSLPQDKISLLRSAFEHRKRSPIIILPPPLTPPGGDKLFEDNDFTYVESVPVAPDSANCMPVQWLRPHQIVDKPELYVDGTSRRDVIQGILGTIYFHLLHYRYIIHCI